MTGSGRPWWQVVKSPKYGLILGVLWAALATLEWITNGGGRARLILAVLATLLAAVYLVSAFRLRRRLRRRAAR